jgi:hypothetical protein
MKRIIIMMVFISGYLLCNSQTETINIRQMTWGPDYQVYLQLDNDSSYSYEIGQLIHADPDEAFSRKTEFIYYPVNFEQSYIDSLLNISNNADEFTSEKPQSPQIRRVTLWGAVGQSIGGGWAHFINCLVYALETRQLELTAPLLKRPESTWKPKPVTDTWKRTHKWHYYAPVELKYAKKEYKIRKKNKQLGDLQSIPDSYIQLMLNTSEKEYQVMIKNKEFKKIAQIDLVKLMLGSPYLSEIQIDYIKSRVLQAVSNYNAQHKPSVLIFDKYEAAVAISLDGLGYKAKKIVFRDQYSLSPMEIMQRTSIIQGIIALINVANSEAFKERLNGLYKK